MLVKRALKYIVLLLVFALLAVGTTYACIQRTLGEPLLPQKEEAVEIIPEAGIDLNGTYDQNHLEFMEVVEIIGEAELTYPQIDGLKNAEVETLVNDTISATAENLKQGILNRGTNISYMTYQVYGSFSNVLSIVLFISDEGYENHETAYLNFNLNDGSRLQLEDLFGAQADLLGIVRSAYYRNLTTNNLTAEYWESLQSPDEQLLYKTVTGYMAESEKAFFFTPTDIHLVGDVYSASVHMQEHADDITVYHKYLSAESLFERDDVGINDVFTCAEMPQGYDHRSIGYLEENFFYDIGLSEFYMSDYVSEEMQGQCLAFVEGRMAALMDEVQQVRQLAKENPDQMYVLFICPYGNIYSHSEYVDGYWQGTASYAVSFNELCKLYEMPKALYDSKYHARLVEAYRNNPYYVLMGGLENAIDDDVQRTVREGEKLYRYDSGEELTLDTLFVEGFDYAAAVYDYTVNHLVRYDGYAYEDAEIAAQGLSYKLAGSGLQITVPNEMMDDYIWLSLDEFDPSALTIWR